jgi:hypothetical protein
LAKEISEKDLVSREACLLFYRKRDISLKEAKDFNRIKRVPLGMQDLFDVPF